MQEARVTDARNSKAEKEMRERERERELKRRCGTVL